MPTAEVSLTLDESFIASTRKLVGRRGLSSYVNRALRFQLQHDRLAGLLDELEREAGPIDPKIIEEAREGWPGEAVDRDG